MLHNIKSLFNDRKEKKAFQEAENKNKNIQGVSLTPQSLKGAKDNQNTSMTPSHFQYSSLPLLPPCKKYRAH